MITISRLRTNFMTQSIDRAAQSAKMTNKLKG